MKMTATFRAALLTVSLNITLTLVKFVAFFLTGSLAILAEAMQLGLKKGLQNQLDQLDSGITISFIEISDIKPPRQVESFFSEVVKAGMERKKDVNNAESYRNQKLSAARAEAFSIANQAKATQKETILAAQGETERSNQILEQIQVQGESARDMIHKKAIPEALSKAGRIHVVKNTPRGSFTIRIQD